jgi:hypothetical protein
LADKQAEETKAGLISAAEPQNMSPTESQSVSAAGPEGVSVPSAGGPGFFRNPGLPFIFVRVCIYLVFADVLGYAVILLARLVLPPFPTLGLPQQQGLSEIAAVAGAFGSARIMAFLEKRQFGEYGLPWKGAFGKLFWQGAAFGLVEISAVVAAMAACGAYKLGTVILHGRELVGWLLFWAAVLLLVGFYEEFAFRGYVQFTAAQGIGFWAAAIVLSLVFGLRHAMNPGETWPGLASVVLSGLFWCFTLQRTKSLWFAVGMHASFDFGETFLYSVPDSGTIFPGHLSSAVVAGPAWITGGTAGPEAGVFDFAVILLFFYVFHRWYPMAASEAAQAAQTEN